MRAARRRKKTKTRVDLPPPHEGQLKIYNDAYESRFNAVCCGRRFGKTNMVTSLSVSTSLSQIAHPETGVLTTGRVGIFTPEYRQGTEIYKEIMQHLGDTVLIESASKTSREIILKTGGVIDFWATNDNPTCGRGRKYHLVLIDEAAFTKSPEFLEEIWPRAILPTLTDYLGHCYAFSTPDGIDDDNFFYDICNNPTSDFKFHHAPTTANPFISKKELRRTKQKADPLVWRQEYRARFVDWSGKAFFNIRNFMAYTKAESYEFKNPYPLTAEMSNFIPWPDPWTDTKYRQMQTTITGIFAVIDATMKGGLKNDGTGVAYWGYNEVTKIAYLLDWDYFDVTSDMLTGKLSEVVAQLNHLCDRINSMLKQVATIFVEDAAYGQVLVSHGNANGWPMKFIENDLMMLGKDDRALMISVAVNSHRVRICKHAYEKVVTFKDVSSNHLIKQLTSYKIRDPQAHKRADDLVDTVTYGVMLTPAVSQADLQSLAKGVLQRKQALIAKLMQKV